MEILILFCVLGSIVAGFLILIDRESDTRAKVGGVIAFATVGILGTIGGAYYVSLPYHKTTGDTILTRCLKLPSGGNFMQFPRPMFITPVKYKRWGSISETYKYVVEESGIDHLPKLSDCEVK